MRAGGPLIHLGTRCSSLDEFIERFAQFATETSMVMPASVDAKVGLEGRFVIRLKDKTTVMSGRCRVDEVRPVSGKTVMRVRLLSMDEASRKVHRQLLDGKRPTPPKPPPLRIVRAPTLLGNAPPPPIGTAPTLIGTVAPVPDTLPALSPLDAPRAPGAALTLPANPLSDLEAADLASFVECTLFEATGDAEEPPGDQSDAKTPLVEAVTTVAPPPRAPTPSQAVTTVAPFPVAPAPPRDGLKRRLATAAPYALCTLVGVLVGYALHRPPPAAPPPPVVVAAPAPVVAKPAAPAAAPTCLATVTTEPDGADVVWGERKLGATPLRDAQVPCGAATVTLRHDRYREVSREVDVAPGTPATLDERLKRPSGTLVLTSTPPRAIFTVNGQRVGAAPRTLDIWRYEHLKVEATLPGHRPWSKTVYVQEPTMKVEAQLAPAPAAKRGFSR